MSGILQLQLFIIDKDNSHLTSPDYLRKQSHCFNHTATCMEGLSPLALSSSRLGALSYLQILPVVSLPLLALQDLWIQLFSLSRPLDEPPGAAWPPPQRRGQLPLSLLGSVPRLN